MSDTQPPAPGWLMGDDGHWKPPTFTFEDNVVRSTPEPGSGDDEKRPKRDHTRAKNEAKRMGKTALGGLFCVAALVGAVAAGNSVYHGVKEDEARVSPIDEEPGEARDRYQGVDVDEIRGEVGPVGDAGTICPGPAEVATVLGEPEAQARYAYDETTRVNGIPLWGVRCNYGAHVTVGAEPHDVEGEVITWLKDSEGDYAVADGPFGETSVRITEAPDAAIAGRGAGSVRVVFDIGERTFWVMVDTDLEDRVDDLAQLVLDRNGGPVAPPAATEPATTAPAP